MTSTLCRALTFILLASSAVAQQDEIKLPVEVNALLPANSAILGAATADLNGDELADYVVVTEETASRDPEDPTRTAFVIVQKPEGKFAVAARNDRAVISKANGGLSEAFDRITADKKTFTLSHAGGRRDKWTADYTFGFSRIDQAWQLIRVEGSRWSEDGALVTFKPPHDFGKIAFEQFDAEKWQGLGEGYKKSKLSKPPIPE